VITFGGGGGSSGLIDNATVYAGLYFDDAYVAESTAQTVVPAGGTLKEFKVRLSAAPGANGGAANDQYTFTVRLNGASTSPLIQCTIVGLTATTCTSLNEVTVTAGQSLSVQAVPANIPNEEPGMAWTATFVGS
jgi:hypothetical protein